MALHSKRGGGNRKDRSRDIEQKFSLGVEGDGQRHPAFFLEFSPSVPPNH